MHDQAIANMVRLTRTNEFKVRSRLSRYIDPDLIDYKHLWDSTLSFNENIAIILDHAKKLGHEDVEDARHDLRMLEIRQAEYEKQLRDEEDQAVMEEWQDSSTNIKRLCDHPAYNQLTTYIKMTIGDHSNGLICVSEGGLGKSTTVVQVLDENLEKSRYAYCNTYSTPLSLYHALYDNRDKLIVLDDVEGLVNNPKCISMLKACLWDVRGVRMVQYRSTTSKLGDYPSSFIFTGKLIMIANKLDEKDINVSAMLSRINYLDIRLSWEEKMSLIKFIARTAPYKKIRKRDRIRIARFLGENTDAATKNLNFRTLIKAYEFFRFDRENWQDLTLRMLEVDPKVREFLWVYDNFPGTVAEQAAEFSKRTGLSRRTFSRYQAKYKTSQIGQNDT